MFSNIKRDKKKINYLIYFLFSIPVICYLYHNVIFNNDIWFLLNSGRYVLEEGIPTIEPFTIHNNMSFVMPQWLSALIFWLIYHFLGKVALYYFVVIIGICILLVFYNLCKIVSNNKTISMINCAFMGILLSNFIVTRPQIFTYLILLVELLLVEKYVSSNNKKDLIGLPILSLVQINLHASMWLLLFAFLIPYIINGIKIKKNNFKSEEYNLKPLLITLITMFVAGLINPYGINAISYLTRSYGISEINSFIREMIPIGFASFNGKIFALLIFMLLFIINFNKNKLNLRFYLLLIGTTLLAFMHNKGMPYFIIMYFLSISYLLKDIELKKINIDLKNKYIVAILKGVKISLVSIFICVSVYAVAIWTNKVHKSKEDNVIKDTVDYIEKNNDLNSVILYVDYDNGGYTEYRGIRSYIDPRAEVFLKANNKKEDIFLEFYKLAKEDDFDYASFIEKYKFTHILVPCDDKFDAFLKSNDEYKLVYTQKYEEVEIMNLYEKT